MDTHLLLERLLRIAAGLGGFICIFYFFKSIIRLGVLNERYQDSLAFWVGRIALYLFRLRILLLPGGAQKRNQIMTWYWPCALFGVISAWFVLVMVAFALLNIAFGAEQSMAKALVASGSALSTLGFATPTTLNGQFLAIIEGGIGLFVVVYLFTFLPSFMDLIHERDQRIAWIYARTQETPSGIDLLEWFYNNHHESDLSMVMEDWERFFRRLAQARSFLPLLCVIRPVMLKQSWIAGIGALMDALALKSTVVANPRGGVTICFNCGVRAIQNFHAAMRGTPIGPRRDLDLWNVQREHFEVACNRLVASGVTILSDRDKAWDLFREAHRQYAGEIAWLAAAISDPLPAWPTPPQSQPPTTAA